MSRKHFVAIAETIRIQYKFATVAERTTIKQLAESLCIDFKAANSNFNRTRFLDACFDGMI